MKTNDFFRLVNDENKTRPGSHVLAPGLSDSELMKWQDDHPQMRLPQDLVDFFQMCNGFRLYVEPRTRNGAVRLMPLRDVQYAPRLMYGENTSCDDLYPKSALALANDPDNAHHLVLDLANGNYYDVDPIAGIEIEATIGKSWCEALGWIANFAGLGH